MATINLSGGVREDIIVKRGDTFILESVRFWTDAAKTIPLDITAYTFEMEVKDSEGLIVLALTMASGFSITAPNLLEVNKPASDMLIPATAPGQPYVYDLEMTTDTDVVSTIMYGNFTVEQDVTNA